jgi:hypothetical protein
VTTSAIGWNRLLEIIDRTVVVRLAGSGRPHDRQQDWSLTNHFLPDLHGAKSAGIRATSVESHFG